MTPEEATTHYTDDGEFTACAEYRISDLGDGDELVDTVVKMVDFSYKLPSAFSQDAICAAPPPQLHKAAPPGTRTREHRSGPRSSHPTGLSPHDSLNRIGSAF